MSILTFLYNLTLGPLELFFDVAYTMAYRITHNPGLSIVVLSLAMNFLVLPLYKRADEMQSEQAAIETKLQPWIKHIKKTFKGDERFMILQTFYRQNNYKPTDILKGSISLLLEIPFFIAAYRFLSSLKILQGVQFGPISDLGAPDGLLVIAGVTINLLPILMTVINFVSSAIYTKGMPLKSKVQLYGIAIIFLVFLYNSPAGLVFYWTLNNLFSLIKNIFYKLKNPKKVLCILFSIVGIVLTAFVLFVHPMDSPRKQMIVIVCFCLLQIPSIIYFISSKLRKTETETEKQYKPNKKVFVLAGLYLTLLLGALIPILVVKASPEEFVHPISRTNPLLYVVNSLMLSAGTFMIWCRVFYSLAKDKGKCIMEYAMWAIAVVATVDYMAFGNNLGNMSKELVFDILPSFSMEEQLINIAVVVVAALLASVIMYKKPTFVSIVCSAAIIGVVAISVIGITSIQPTVKDAQKKYAEAESGQPTLHFSKTGKNVVVFMLDRAISGYYPYIMNEKPELKEQFKGFTYYPNTISYGGFTNVGTPGLFGGYDYTPEEINKRDKESLESKQNEALKVMPTIFGENDYKVTVCDPPYAGYSWIPDVSIYKDCKNVNAYVLEGMIDSKGAVQENTDLDSLSRNFYCYSIFKAVPLCCQPGIYDYGRYNNANSITTIKKETLTDEISSEKYNRNKGFYNAYSVLRSLPTLSRLEDKKCDNFIMMCSNLTHEPEPLQEPEYEPKEVVNNEAYDTATGNTREAENGNKITFTWDQQSLHYQINACALIQIGKWLDWMRENEVYDNTKIIIASDHGRPLYQFNDLMFGKEQYEDGMFYTSLLLYKDFDSNESSTNDDFMTIADTPTLATNNLIQNAVNPFTKKAINSERKKGEQHVFYTDKWDTNVNNGNKFLPGTWISVKDNIFDKNNWRILGNY